MSETICWKIPQEPVPLSAVQMIPFDGFGNVLIMHRAEGLRSASNVWSFPSGLHDIGETKDECVRRELMEEYGLAARHIFLLGTYENIAGDPKFDGDKVRQQYHWNITVFGVEVLDVSQAINKEPEKHDIMKTDVKLWDLQQVSVFLNQHTFHPSFDEFWRRSGRELITRLCLRAFS